jgi:DNA-binding transcriptional ArsR family regulator
METTQLDRTFAALADPTRRAILERLTEGDATVNELAEPFPVSVQAVSKHLKVLESAGLITRGRTAQLRPSHLEGGPLRQIADWVDGYRTFWEGAFERMDTRLKSASRETARG